MADRTIGWLARNHLDRSRPLLMAMQIGAFLVGCIFYVLMSNPGTFREDVWGGMAYSVPAKFWALLNMSASSMTVVGLAKPVRSRLVMIGAGINCCQYAALAWSVIFSGGDPVIGLYAGIIFLPLNLWMLTEAATYDK